MNIFHSQFLDHLKTTRTPVIVSPGSPGKGQGGEGEEDGGEDEQEGKYEGRPGVARPLNKGKDCSAHKTKTIKVTDKR